MASKDMSFFGFNRPEYIPTPELALSELAWSLVPPSVIQELRSSAPRGIAFGSRGNTSKTPPVYTKPKSGSEEFSAFSRQVKNTLSLNDADAVAVSRVLLSELELFGSQKASRSVAAPLSLPLALLQERSGVTGKRNPANIALILEQAFALGQGENSAATCLLNAYTGNAGKGLPGWIDETIASLLSQSGNAALQSLSTSPPTTAGLSLRVPSWVEKADSTPFRWFATTWGRLCNDGWIDAMPRRRWSDWASCVTRTAIGTSFLFEMHLYYRLVPALVSDQEPRDTVAACLDESNRLLAWDASKRRAAQDVGPAINRLAESGSKCQSLLNELAGELELPAPADFDSDPDGLVNWLSEARGALSPAKSQVSKWIARKLDDKPPSSAKNVRETIRYSLLDRGAGQSIDLYSLLRGAGPITYVDPGQEWLVTMASLCSAGPGQPTRIVALNRALAQLGISAATPTLVERLEAFGLSRSSHDADDAIEIQPAF